MKTNIIWTLVVFLCSLTFLVFPTSARWIENGVLIVENDNQQKMPVIAQDGSGGAYLAWADGRDGFTKIYAQRIDNAGEFHWEIGGVALCPGMESWQQYPLIISDNLGGAIVIWSDYRNGNYDLFAQKIDEHGNIQWSTEGVVICTAPSDEYNCLSCAHDGAGGVIVTWWDMREGSGIRHIYAQRISANGVVEWAVDGIPICPAADDVGLPEIVSDGDGGAIIFWTDSRTTSIYSSFYGQRINGDGEIQWLLDGLNIPISAPTYYKAIPDDKGGAFITTQTGSSPDQDIYVSRIDSSGTLVWNAGCCSITAAQIQSVIASDKNDGVVVMWQDRRDGMDDIFAQRFDTEGNALWSNNGISVCRAPDVQNYIQIVSDAEGSSMVIWRDARDGVYAVYAQKINLEGQVCWDIDGLPVYDTEDRALYPKAVSSGDDGVFLTWYTDPDQTQGNVYVQKFSSAGYWGNSDPVINSIVDNPIDEGGIIRINIRSSDYDQEGVLEYPVTGYNIWKRTGLSSSISLYIEDQRQRIEQRTNLNEIIQSNEPVINHEQAVAFGFPPGDWASIGFHASKQDFEYCLLVPTESDSTATGIPWNDYVVTAHTEVPSVFFVSGIDSGYSVDNLPPVMPQGLEGRQSSSPLGLVITWLPNMETDFSYYALYRDTKQVFEPRPENRCAVTTDISFVDPEWTINSGFCYILEAVDRHGNKSIPAYLVPNEIVSSMLQSYSIEPRGQSIIISWTIQELAEKIEFVVLRMESTKGCFEQIALIESSSEIIDYSYKDNSVDTGILYSYRIEYINSLGTKELFQTEPIQIVPALLMLSQNYPNPFNPTTMIKYYLPEKCSVLLEIFDVSGKRIASLVNKNQEKGQCSIEWRGKDFNGNSVSSGTYFYRLKVGKETISKKMVLLR